MRLQLTWLLNERLQLQGYDKGSDPPIQRQRLMRLLTVRLVAFHRVRVPQRRLLKRGDTRAAVFVLVVILQTNASQVYVT